MGADVTYLLSKTSKRCYVILHLARGGINMHDIVAVYCSVIRSVLEYTCPVWHCGLTDGQSHELENVQRRCLRIIFFKIYRTTRR